MEDHEFAFSRHFGKLEILGLHQLIRVDGHVTIQGHRSVPFSGFRSVNAFVPAA